MSSGKAGSQLEWSFGLRNSAGKYLTAEAFQNKIVCVSPRPALVYHYYFPLRNRGADVTNERAAATSSEPIRIPMATRYTET